MDAVIKHKEKLNAIYRKNLSAAIQLPTPYQHWRFNIIVPNKEDNLKALFDADSLLADTIIRKQMDATLRQIFIRI
jgi:3-methyladenine DNA glycosylase Tag